MNILKNIIRFLLAPLFILLFIGVLAITAVYLYYTPGLPSEEQISQIELQIPLRVYDKDKKLIAEYGSKRRIPLAFEEIPKQLTDAFVSIEDARFYQHHGVDAKGVARAIIKLVTTGSRSQGASTITMQLARNTYLTSEKTFDRKIREAFLALKIEQTLSKPEILQLYLNKIYLGSRAYGVAAAAYVYYGKNINDLTLAQSAMIAGLPKAPSRYNPLVNPERAKIRRDYVLKRMLKFEKITPSEYKDAIDEPLSARRHRTPIETNAPYMAEMVRSYMVEKFGKEEAYTQGFKVYTTLDAEAQKVADETLRNHLLSYTRRHGYRGAEKTINLDEFPTQEDKLNKLKTIPVYSGLYPAIVLSSDKELATLLIKGGETTEIGKEQVKWARKYISEDRRGSRPTRVNQVLHAGNIVRVQKIINTDKDGVESTEWKFTQVPKVAGALVSMDPSDGAVNALAGGFDYYLSKFNRATQAERQPGSSFKPFIYTAALAKGFTPKSKINDAPIHIPGSRWRPENYGGRFHGPTTLADGLAKSRNLVSIRLLRRIGVEYARNFAERFGLRKDHMPANLTLALGTGTVTPFEMATAYSSFANGGYKVDGHFITEITNHKGELIYRPENYVACLDCELDPANINDLPEGSKPAIRIINTKTHYEAVGLMQGVTHRGTAVRAGRTLKRKDIAGKTGTTNDQKDAWFCGYTPNKVSVVWIGFDHLAPLGNHETATGAALPVWIDFMKKRLAGVKDAPWQKPEHTLLVKIDAITGKVASKDSSEIIEEEIKDERKTRFDKYDDNDATGFEVFSDLPADALIPVTPNDAGFGSQNNGSSGSPAVQRSQPKPKRERVEIPEQLF